MSRKEDLITGQQEYTLPQHAPEVLIFPHPEGVDEYAANSVIEQINRKPSSVLTLPTGNTPRGMYERLVTANQEGQLDVSQTTVFNLGEYYPITSTHPNSYTEGSAGGVSGTPSFFVGKSDPSGTMTGQIIVGAQPYSAFQTAIDQLLK